MHATEIAAAVRSGRVSAVAIAERHLAALRAEGDTLVAVTRILADRALAEAAAVDGAVAAGRDPGPLAGVPYGVKDLFDVAGLPTTAGSSLYADAPPARADAEAVRRLRGAGAILMATLNMDEFAYGFATINARHGTTRNPHDPARLAGGSSGGSAAAVAAGLLPFSLGSDTNGSIRVPASLCGLYGLKPTHGALPMDGVFPFAESFDDIGPFATSVDDLRVVWEALGGTGANASGVIRVARLGGRFRANADPEQIAAIDAIASDAPLIDLPDIARARAAAFLMTAAEGGAVHRPSFEAGHAMAFDPATRDRLLAGALLPPVLYDQASAFGREFRAALTAIFGDHDVLLAPAAPCVAPPVSDPRILIDGEWTPARRDLGIHTQPISFAALPALAIPLRRPGRLPLGLQLIGRPGGEGTLFRFAAQLEDAGVAGVSEPAMLFQGEDA